MKRLLYVLPMLVASICFADQKNDAARRQEIESLQKRADAAHGKDCVKLALEVSRGYLDEADRLFVAADPAQAHKALDQATHYAQRSTACSIESHKQEKQTEINLRKLIKRTQDIQRTVAFEDRAHVQASIDAMEKCRDQLLRNIFGLKPSSP